MHCAQVKRSLSMCSMPFETAQSVAAADSGKTASFIAQRAKHDDHYGHFCRALLELLKKDIKPRDIMTRKAFENAITVVMALGGSTNAVLHLLAMAHAVDVPLTLDDFQAISDNTPFIADLKPSGKYVMEDVHKVSCPALPCPAPPRPALPCPAVPCPAPAFPSAFPLTCNLDLLCSRKLTSASMYERLVNQKTRSPSLILLFK